MFLSLPEMIREDLHKKSFFSGRTTKVRVTPPPLEVSGSEGLSPSSNVIEPFDLKIKQRQDIDMAYTRHRKEIDFFVFFYTI